MTRCRSGPAHNHSATRLHRVARSKGWLSAIGPETNCGLWLPAEDYGRRVAALEECDHRDRDHHNLARNSILYTGWGQLPRLGLSTPISQGGRSDVRLGKGRCGRANFLPELVAAGSRLGGIEQQAGSMEGLRQGLHRSCELVYG